MASKDVTKEMKDLAKDAKLQDGEKLVNVYSKVEMESLGGDGNYIPKGKKFHVHPEHIDHLIKKGFAKKIGEVKTEVPNLEEPKEPITILV